MCGQMEGCFLETRSAGRLQGPSLLWFCIDGYGSVLCCGQEATIRQSVEGQNGFLQAAVSNKAAFYPRLFHLFAERIL